MKVLFIDDMDAALERGLKIAEAAGHEVQTINSCQFSQDDWYRGRELPPELEEALVWADVLVSDRDMVDSNEQEVDGSLFLVQILLRWVDHWEDGHSFFAMVRWTGAESYSSSHLKALGVHCFSKSSYYGHLERFMEKPASNFLGALSAFETINDPIIFS